MKKLVRKIVGDEVYFKITKKNPIDVPNEELHKIFLFSPVRTGSTLVYNILKDVCDRNEVVKVHNINIDRCDKNPVVITYRNPLDSLSSSIQRYGLSPTDEVIREQIDEIKWQGLDDLLRIKNHPNVLLLRYEDFYNDYNVIFNSIEKYFRIKISNFEKEKLVNKYKIDNIIQKISDYSDFSQYDRATQFHGKHISKFKGQPNSYVDFFTKDQIELIKKEFHRYLIKLGYKK